MRIAVASVSVFIKFLFLICFVSLFHAFLIFFEVKGKKELFLIWGGFFSSSFLTLFFEAWKERTTTSQ